METRAGIIQCKANKDIVMEIIPGHFATNHSHVNYYVDVSGIKTKHKMAKDVAALLCSKYFEMVSIDTIICMEGTEMIGAFVANELSQSGPMKMNSGKEINVLTPEVNNNNQLIFRDNMQKVVWNKQILLLLASASTGKTINRAIECIEYYSGQLVGVAAVFSAAHDVKGVPIRSVFSEKDIYNYHSYSLEECQECAKNQKLDAIINSYGYSKI